jgi:predicted DNA-binding ribbon-helix-helix protein
MIGVSGRLAKVRLETVMWAALHDVARRKGRSVDDLVVEIHGDRTCRNLAAAIRNYLVAYYREAAKRVFETQKTRESAGLPPAESFQLQKLPIGRSRLFKAR